MNKGLDNLYRGGRAFSRIMSAKMKREHIPWYLFILITERCNMFCKYCYADIPNRLKDKSRKIKEWSTEAVFRIIDDFYEIGGDALLAMHDPDVPGPHSRVLLQHRLLLVWSKVGLVRRDQDDFVDSRHGLTFLEMIFQLQEGGYCLDITRSI